MASLLPPCLSADPAPSPAQILDVWERDWILFEPTVIEDFRQRLSGVVSTGAEEPQEEEEEEEDVNMAAFASILQSEAAPSAPATEPTPAAPALEPPVSTPAKPGFKSGGFKPSFQPSAFNEVLPDAPEAEEEEDVDGAPMEDVDGEAVDVDGEEVDVDGEAVDVDGEEMPLEDVDGEPSAAQVQEREKVETVVINDEAMDLAQSDDDIF